VRCARWGTRGIELAEVAPPELPAGWVRLRVLACGICGSDLHGWRGETAVQPGGVPGHEIAAVPVAGPEGGGLAADRLVAVEPRSWCGACGWCAAGLTHLCPAGSLLGVTAPGGLAELVAAPPASVHAVPDGVSPRVAALAEPLAVAVRAVERAALAPGSRVLVLGAGTIGLLCGLLARERAGAAAITVRHRHQAAAARALGLHALEGHQIGAWAEAEEPDVVFETVGGQAETLDQAIACCRAGGRIVVLGLFAGYRALDARAFLLKELQLLASNTYGRGPGGSQFQAAVALLPGLAGELAILQTHQFRLAEVDQAFACAADKQSGAIKVVVEP
jgi:(R,R)-butanediol dehydrogenase / meso-butanediol dehydrogenase / diacetyl reductase